MMYCHTHDRHYDSDYVEDCPECEEEDMDEANDRRAKDEGIEEIPMFKGTREALDKIEIKKI